MPKIKAWFFLFLRNEIVYYVVLRPRILSTGIPFHEVDNPLSWNRMIIKHRT
jgi:hypothetical protein